MANWFLKIAFKSLLKYIHTLFLQSLVSYLQMKVAQRWTTSLWKFVSKGNITTVTGRNSLRTTECELNNHLLLGYYVNLGILKAKEASKMGRRYNFQFLVQHVRSLEVIVSILITRKKLNWKSKTCLSFIRKLRS